MADEGTCTAGPDADIDPTLYTYTHTHNRFQKFDDSRDLYTDNDWIDYHTIIFRYYTGQGRI